jgi:dienelactone hydrolase
VGLTSLIHRLRRHPVSSRLIKKESPQDRCLSPSIQLRRRFQGATPCLSHKITCPDLAWQTRARKSLGDLLGGAKTLVTEIREFRELTFIDHKSGRITKGQFIDSSGVVIPAYLGLPHGNKQPKRWLLCLQGHTSGMHVSLGLDQSESFYLPINNRELDIANQALIAGYGVVCIEQYSLGERRETELRKVAPHPCQDAAMHSIALGHTLTGIRVAECLQVITFLRKHKMIDGPIGLAGNSLGGTISMYAAALDNSIDFAVASSCISTFERSILSLYHCTDLYIPNLAIYFDTADILSLIAPRPLILAQGVCDPIFPLSGFRDVFKDVEEVYKYWGAPNAMKAVLGTGGHKFYGSLIFPTLKRILEASQ